MVADSYPPSGYSGIFPFHKVHYNYKKLLQKRRKAFLNEIDSFAIFCGVQVVPGEENSWFMNPQAVFQEPALLYLTGINQTGVILILNPQGTERSVLFIPEKDEKTEFWNGRRLGVSFAKDKNAQEDFKIIHRLTGISIVKPISNFESYLLTLVSSSSVSHGYVFYHEYPKPGRNAYLHNRLKIDHNWRFKERLQRIIRQKSKWKKFTLQSAAPLHFSHRSILNSNLLPQFKKAVSLTRKGFLDTVANWRHFHTEKSMAAYLRYSLVKHDHTSLSFPLIVASGANAAILHYIKNDCKINHSGLVLLDFGIRYGEINTDVSRTLPNSGQFNPLQLLLYKIVLDTQAFNQKNVRAGKTIRQLNAAAWEYLEKRFTSSFLSFGGKAKRPYEIQPHSISHLIGITVHEGDPMRLYQDTPLKAGCVISNEPGIYGYFNIKIGGRHFREHLGIRIEDDLLVTKNGCENLTASIPKTPSSIEKLITNK